MPKNEKEEKSSGAKYALWGGIITALIGLIGTGLTIYFQSVYPLRAAERVTQTAEARLTAQAGPATPTRAPTDTPPTPVPASPTTVPPADIVSPTPLPPTAAPTLAVSGVKYCVDTQALNVRTGPGLEYPAIGTLNDNDCLAFDGRAEGTPWVRISPGQPGYLDFGGMWVYGQFLRPQDFDERLPAVITPAPPPTPYLSPTPAG
ncbi:MAG: hypothetical protein FD146_1364 [Anaerolineaceae bacterium]|nr:MAG: hypothetical protein FD146_1364 [Anaerolineaceae bacterium]